MKRIDSGKKILHSFEALRAQLKSIVYDQGEAVDEVVDAFVQMAYKPVGVPPRALFTFLGACGVGKCHLAEALAQNVEDLAGVKVFDMEQYVDLEEGGRLFGVAGVEVVQEGELPRFIRENPN
ncbi:MAG: hypothetical protein OEL66_07760, partial [Desulfobulbaceae bacterium]|nr:hypothetical protein [Desulfobulbaceae bacterium]